MDRMTRLGVSAALVLFACAGSYFVARGARKPFSAAAPGYRTMGPAGAPIQVVEFSDLECPACRIAEPVVRPMMKLYDGKVRLVFKHFPLERMHHYARRAAIAAECAGRQGKFWEYHHELYDHQDDWTNDKVEERFAAYAKTVKLDEAAFQACRKDPVVDVSITNDARDAWSAFVNSTPTFFINGKRFVGAKDLAERGVPYIDKELKK
jgi:protein-disulfide isomerase